MSGSECVPAKGHEGHTRYRSCFRLLEAVKVHHLVPCVDEVVDKLLVRIA